MNLNPKYLFISAAVAGILSSGPLTSAVARADDPTAACAEKNSCKGTGHCAGVATGKDHECAGKNECMNNTITKTTRAQCDQYGGDWQG